MSLDSSAGQFLAFLSAVSFAFANVFISRTGNSRGDKGIIFSVCMTLCISLTLWVVMGPDTNLLTAGEHWRGVLWFAVAGLSVMVFGRSLLYESVRRLGVSRASAVKRLNPFFSIILASLFLREAITARDLIGVSMIAIAFGILIRESFLQSKDGHKDAPPTSYYMFGVSAAFAYAAAYVARKLGLVSLPDPLLGTSIGAITGLLGFFVFGLFVERYRSNLRNVFANLDRWIVLSAVMVSLGQILLFAALSLEKVSIVVMIASLEIFVSMFFSVVIFRAEKVPSVMVIVSAFLATAGVFFAVTG